MYENIFNFLTVLLLKKSDRTTPAMETTNLPKMGQGFGMGENGNAWTEGKALPRALRNLGVILAKLLKGTAKRKRANGTASQRPTTTTLGDEKARLGQRETNLQQLHNTNYNQFHHQ